MSYKYNSETETAWRTVEDTAKYFSVSKTTIYVWIKTDKIRIHSSAKPFMIDINSVEQGVTNPKKVKNRV